MKQFLRELFCWHIWQEHLIFGVGVYHDKKRCIKCGKSKTTWSGTQLEWRQRHGLDRGME